MTSALLDHRTGLLTDVHRMPRDPRMPSCWVGYGAHVGRADRWAPWRADGFGFGASLGDEAAARGAAIGEAVERYCGNAVPDRLRHASWTQLRAAGDDALDPDSLTLYSQRQHAQPGFPFVPFTRDLSVGWVPGTDLATGGDVWVPASLAFLDYIHGPRAAEPATNSPVYSGIAAGRDRQAAVRSALEELFERDACTIWWAAGGPAPRIDDRGRITGGLGRPPDADTLTVQLLAVPSAFPVPVVAALLDDHHPDGTRHLAFGSACRADPAAAAGKAVVEALGLLQLTRQLDDPAGEVWRAVAAGEIERHVFLPYRADRRYREVVGADYRSLTDLPSVAQLYLDPSTHGGLLRRLAPDGTVGLDALLCADPDDYVEFLAAQGIRAVVVDLTTPDVASAGLVVVRVVAAGLVGNAPPAFPLRGGPRLYEVPVRLGWRDRPLTEDQLVTDPIPLA